VLTDAELQNMFDRLQVPEVGRKRIRSIRDNVQSRVTSSTRKSGKLRYAPLKMGFAVEAEAASTEYVAVVEWDHDQTTFEFYPQPEALKISYRLASSTRRYTTTTTPDYLRITESGFFFVECKTEEQLNRLAKEAPGRFMRDEDGRWRSPPAEEAAAELGCHFVIRSSAENNWTLHENAEILKDYYIGTARLATKDEVEVVQDRLKAEGWVSLFELIHMEPAVSADAIYKLIVDKQVYFPLAKERLTDQEASRIYRDEMTYRAFETYISRRGPSQFPNDPSLVLEPGVRFTWDGVPWRVINRSTMGLTIQCLDPRKHEAMLADFTHAQLVSLVQAGRVSLAHEANAEVPDVGHEKLRCASPEDLREALLKLEVLEGRPSEGNPLRGRKTRATKYWLRAFKEAEAAYGVGLIGLLPQRKGNRKPKVSDETLELARETIRTDWETIRRKQRKASWGRYRTAADERGLHAISYARFCAIVKERRGHKQTVSRLGEKAAYDQEPHYMLLEWTTPRHGVRPWHIAHIDHTPLPLKFVDATLAMLVPTIWLTVLMDAYDRMVLAYYLSFDEPSYRSCMMVLRDCVRRHNRVPQIIVTDGGPEFKSTYYETQLAMLRVTKRERMRGKPRSGSVCERLFNTTQEQFVSNMLGGTEIQEKYFRRVSKEVDPARNAVWTMDRFDQRMEFYIEKVYHPSHHGGLGMSPLATRAYGIRAHGERNHRIIPYDRTFIIQSCPAVHRGTAKVTTGGIKVNYILFKCEEFNWPGVQGTNVPARYDPFNKGLAWAFVRGEWRECYSEHYPIFRQYTERAMRIATERIKLTARLAGKSSSLNAQRLAMFLQESEKEEDLLKQLKQDSEALNHRFKVQAPSGLGMQTPVGAFEKSSPKSAPVRPAKAKNIRELGDL
jgi:putative transposase